MSEVQDTGRGAGAATGANANARSDGDVQRGGLSWLVPDWPAPASVKAAATLRAGGVSVGPYASLNLAGHVGDDPGAVITNRQRLGAALGVPQALSDPALWLDQAHGARAIRAETRSTPSGGVADAVYARTAGQVCAVLTADCLPLLVCDTAGSVVAAVHAGWRGLAAGVIEQTLTALQRPGGDLLAWLGPAIGPNVFEVGAQVRERFIDDDIRAARAFRPSPRHTAGTHWLADIYTLARQRLSACGVERVYGGHWCTFSAPGRFYSYRRDAVTGRMASLIWIDAI